MLFMYSILRRRSSRAISAARSLLSASSAAFLRSVSASLSLSLKRPRFDSFGSLPPTYSNDLPPNGEALNKVVDDTYETKSTISN